MIVFTTAFALYWVCWVLLSAGVLLTPRTLALDWVSDKGVRTSSVLVRKVCDFLLALSDCRACFGWWVSLLFLVTLPGVGILVLLAMNGLHFALLGIEGIARSSSGIMRLFDFWLRKDERP
jgi:hypothetical protein